ITPREEYHFKLVVEDIHAPGDLQIPSVIPHLSQQRERGAIRTPVNLHIELLEGAPKLAKPARPISQFPPSLLRHGAHSVNDVRVQSDSRHRQKVPRIRRRTVHTAHSDASGLKLPQ